MHNYRLARERHNENEKKRAAPGGRYFVFVSELHTLLRPGVERWVASRQASIPEGGAPILHQFDFLKNSFSIQLCQNVEAELRLCVQVCLLSCPAIAMMM